MSRRQPRTVAEAVAGLLVRRIPEDGEIGHLGSPWCGRGWWLGPDRGRDCSPRCALIRAWVAAERARAAEHEIRQMPLLESA